MYVVYEFERMVKYDSICFVQSTKNLLKIAVAVFAHFITGNEQSK